ncbi:MAG: hypothetical protein WCP97_04340 [bacterium]
MTTSAIFSHDTYMIRKKVMKLFGGAFHIYDPSGNLVLFSELKAFKLKEDIRIYTGEDKQTEVLKIAARQIIDFAATYDIYDSKTEKKLGALKRKGLKSILKDEWIILDAEDKEVGLIKEDSTLMALLRRFINLIPQTFYAFIGEKQVASYKQNFNPFVLKITIDFSSDTEKQYDKRLGLAAGILLSAIEGRQKS